MLILQTFTTPGERRFNQPIFWLLTCVIVLCSCSGNGDKSDLIEQDKQLSFEILQLVAPDNIIVWVNTEMDQATFDALLLPDGWFKNEVRESEPDRARFTRSPNATMDGPLIQQEWFGHTWQQNAVIIETNIAVDGQSLLRGNRVAKYHEVEFMANRTLNLLIAPNGDQYLRITRDAERSAESPRVPSTWRVGQYQTIEAMTLTLPNPTLNIRLDNKDSYQGPISPIPTEQLTNVNFGEVPADDPAAPPLELSLTLCDDPANLLALRSALMENSDSPSYGERDLAAMQALLQAPTEGPIYMVNLIKFREVAEYRDGRETSLTGREANSLYAPVEFLQAIGAQPAFTAEVLGQSEDWDQVVVVEYPCPIAFLAMSVHPDFKARLIHKDAGLEKSIVMATMNESLQSLASASDGKDESGDLALVEVLRFNEQAQYPNNSEEPPRSGQAAMQLYDDLVAPVAANLGLTRMHDFAVKGVLIGDGSDWDGVRITSVPNEDSMLAYNANAVVQSAMLHRDAALAQEYSVLTQTTTNFGMQGLTRGSRYCEIILVDTEQGQPKARVWGSQGLNDCPQERLDNLNLEQIADENNAILAVLNGPRIWLVDSVGGQTNEPKLQVFGELLMRRLAELVLNGSQGSGGEQSPYTETTVKRNTTYRFDAGQMVYELTSPNNETYVMQSISLMEQPTLTELDLPNLETLLQLPAGWTYMARSLSEELVMIADGEATVIIDSLGNAYQKEGIRESEK